MIWERVHHRDRRAVTMADRHYSRQNPGTPEFTRPGNKIVLMHFLPDGTPAALWASQRPDPKSGMKRKDGLDAWDCSMFRIEHKTLPASELIFQAVCCTLGIWRDVRPSDGFVTTVDPRYVAPIKRRSKDKDGKPITEDVWGYCYLKAGWEFLRMTKARDLVMLQLSIRAMVWEHCEVIPATNYGAQEILSL